MTTESKPTTPEERQRIRHAAPLLGEPAREVVTRLLDELDAIDSRMMPKHFCVRTRPVTTDDLERIANAILADFGSTEMQAFARVLLRVAGGK
jgi:hypothetical protein